MPESQGGIYRPKQMYHATLVPVVAKTKDQETALKAEGYVTHYIAQAFPMRIFHPTDPNIEPKVIRRAEEMEEGWVDSPKPARDHVEKKRR